MSTPAKKFIEKYLKTIFPKKIMIFDNSLIEDKSELYGFKGVHILVLVKQNEIHYKLNKRL